MPPRSLAPAEGQERHRREASAEGQKRHKREASAEEQKQHGNAAVAESPERYAGGDGAEVLQGCFPVTERKLREEYSMPAAFDAYRILPRRGEQSGKTQP
ncbi:MAG: hypothetical protein K2N94_16715 [Lachnospiraceae bacterium]|nr:hypothetical protein [Lachnospiraceae bacterium]